MATLFYFDPCHQLLGLDIFLSFLNTFPYALLIFGALYFVAPYESSMPAEWELQKSLLSVRFVKFEN